MFRLLPLLVALIYLLWRIPHLLPARLWKHRGVLRLFLAALYLYGAAALIYGLLRRPDPATLGFRFWAWSGLLPLGFFVSVLLVLVPTDLLRVFWGLGAVALGKRGAASPVDRRGFLREAGDSLLLALPLAGTLTGASVAANGPRVKEVRVPVTNLHPDLVGLRIAQITDLHVGGTILEGYVRKVVDQLQSLKPDLIAVTGDMVDGSVETLGPHVGPLADLKAPLGVFYVTGNHEYYSGVGPWLEHFSRHGMTPLLNEQRILAKGKAKLLVAGVPDPAGAIPDPSQAIQGAAASDFKLLLAHRPNTCDSAAQAGFDLQLSGHTHAGQFFPWAFYVPFAHPYYRGLNRHLEKLWVYVSAGTGYWGLPNRFGVASEITLLTLDRA